MTFRLIKYRWSLITIQPRNTIFDNDHGEYMLTRHQPHFQGLLTLVYLHEVLAIRSASPFPYNLPGRLTIGGPHINVSLALVT